MTPGKTIALTRRTFVGKVMSLLFNMLSRFVVASLSINKCLNFLYESESRSVVSDSLWPHGLYSLWNSPGQNTGVGSHSLLQGIFPSQGLNPGLHCRKILYQLGHKGSPSPMFNYCNVHHPLLLSEALKFWYMCLKIFVNRWYSMVYILAGKEWLPEKYTT